MYFLKAKNVTKMLDFGRICKNNECFRRKLLSKLQQNLQKENLYIE